MAAARVISTKKFVVGITNGQEKEMSQVSDGKVERTLRAWLLLSYVLCDAWCVLLICPLSGDPSFPFIDQGEVGITDGRKKKNQR